MSVAIVKPRLAELQEEIQGVTAAYAHGPTAINAADMPLFVNQTRAAQHDWQIAGSDLDQEAREYGMRLYVLPFGAGVPGEAEEACEPFFDRVRDFFAARPSLGGLEGVQQAVLLGDSGVVAMRYPEGGDLYWGIEFRLRVTELIEVVYDVYE